jgi:hypothetical protein
MNRKPVKQKDESATPVTAKKQHPAPKLAELGSLAALTKMDGIPHNGVISGQAP